MTFRALSDFSHVNFYILCKTVVVILVEFKILHKRRVVKKKKERERETKIKRKD